MRFGLASMLKVGVLNDRQVGKEGRDLRYSYD